MTRVLMASVVCGRLVFPFSSLVVMTPALISIKLTLQVPCCACHASVLFASDLHFRIVFRMEGVGYRQTFHQREDIPGEEVSRELLSFVLALFAIRVRIRYNESMEVEDAVHNSILTLKEGFEGIMTDSTIEIGVIGMVLFCTYCIQYHPSNATLQQDKKFRVLTPAEVKDYLGEVE